MEAGFAGIWVSVSNPNDVVAEAIWQESGHYDWRRVIGSGTTLDSARFQHAISHATGYDPQSIHAWMLGEHGFSEFACWSHVTLGCLTADEVEAQTGRKFDRDKLEEEARRGGYVTMVGKHCTEYSIARGTVKIVSAILGDTKLVTPVSTRIEGVYGVTGIWASLRHRRCRRGAHLRAGAFRGRGGQVAGKLRPYPCKCGWTGLAPCVRCIGNPVHSADCVWIPFRICARRDL